MSYICPETKPGTYVLDGYYSMLQSDALNFNERPEKTISKVAIEFLAEEQTTPNLLYCHVGYGSQPKCLTWDTSAKQKKLECLTERTRIKHKLRNTRPDDIPSFKFWRRGVYLAWRFFSKNTGGGACYNRVELTVKKSQGDWR